MSRYLSNAAIQSFDSDVKQAYQGKEKLAGRYRLRTGVVGDSHRFPVIRRTVAKPVLAGSEIPLSNVEYDKPQATLTDWAAREDTDIFTQATVNFSERMLLADTLAWAIARRRDQMVIDAVSGSHAGASGTAQAAVPLASKFGADELAKIKGQFLDAGVSDDMITIIAPARWFRLFGTDETLASRDFGARTSADVRTGAVYDAYGMRVVFVGNRANEEGFDSAGGLGWAFAYEAVGMAIGIDSGRTDIQWKTEKQAWATVVPFKAGACVIDRSGVIPLTGGVTT